MSRNFEIAETKRFLDTYPKVLGHNTEKIYSKIKATIYPQLRSSPFIGKNIKKLAVYSPVTWRYRIGDYRILYRVSTEHKLVIIDSIRPRKDAYQ